MLGEIFVEDYVVEWDDEKNKINKKKHGLSFETAARIFLDKNLVEDYDYFHSDDEDRYKIIGKVGKILTVIYTERGENYRIISARRATKREEDIYYGQYQNL